MPRGKKKSKFRKRIEIAYKWSPHAMVLTGLLAAGTYFMYKIFEDRPEETRKPPAEARPAAELVKEVPLKITEPVKEEKPEPNYKLINATVTAYCPQKCCCGDDADGKTSIGDDAYVFDGVAADPKAIPYRTKIEIPGIGVKEVDDTGGAMRQAWKKGKYHIDVRMSHDDAIQWGREPKEVKVYSKD